jgi:hypothetical protein
VSRITYERKLRVSDRTFEYSGAGIGGLVLAVTIGKFAGHRNVQLDLYEAHDAITTTGAGIVISRRTQEIVEALGLYEEISRVSSKPASSTRGLSKSLLIKHVLICTSRAQVQEIRYPRGWFRMVLSCSRKGQVNFDHFAQS